MDAIIVADADSLWIIVGAIALFLGVGAFGLNYNLRKNRASAEKDAQELRKEVRRMRSTQSSEALSEVELRQRALEEALTRNPQLAEATDSDSVRELQRIVDEITEEMRLRHQVAELKAKQDSERQREEAARQIAAQRAAAQLQFERDMEALRRKQQQEREAAEAARSERLAAMSPLRRWIATHTPLALGITGFLVVALSAGAYLLVSQEIERRQAAEAQAQAQAQAEEKAAERAELLASCDLDQVAKFSGTVDVMNAWATCDDPDVRLAVVEASSVGTLTAESLMALAGDSNADVRENVARRQSLTVDIQKLLVSDSDVQVRSALADRTSLSPAIQEELASDESEEVRLRIARNRSVDAQLLGQLLGDPVGLVRLAAASNPETLVDDLDEWADDPDDQFRQVVWNRIYDHPCERGVPPEQRLTGTTWVSKTNNGDRYYRLDDDCDVAYGGEGERYVNAQGNSSWSWDGRILRVSINNNFWSEIFEFVDGQFVGQESGFYTTRIWVAASG